MENVMFSCLNRYIHNYAYIKTNQNKTKKKNKNKNKNKNKTKQNKTKQNKTKQTKQNKTKTILFLKKSMFKQNVLFDWGIKKRKNICNAALN
jgi:hypothetical protein